ncbi:hypothetical protein [Asanoa iriomotensis]|uniref:hypothetical protein n=1 Tax=Asanoa iriomotensis TaxID=234613 RepID=UPI00194152CC|nr:hypothetical protein [Asanoa iriomotensis]
MLAGLAACADPGASPLPPPASDGPVGPSVPPAAATGDSDGRAALDIHRPGDLGFYESFNMDGTPSTERFDNLEEGKQASTAVIIAQVVDIVSISLPAGDATTLGVVLQPTDVVAGALPDESAHRLTVALPAGSTTDEEQLAKLRRRLPAQPGLWFLRQANDSFHPISPQGLFVQGNNRVETPLTRKGDGDMASEGRNYRRLSALTNEIRGVR